jgi:hypothetical protein
LLAGDPAGFPHALLMHSSARTRAGVVERRCEAAAGGVAHLHDAAPRGSARAGRGSEFPELAMVGSLRHGSPPPGPELGKWKMGGSRCGAPACADSRFGPPTAAKPALA